MKTLFKIGAGAIAPALVVTMLASTPAAAQHYRDRDRDNDCHLYSVSLVGGIRSDSAGDG